MTEDNFRRGGSGFRPVRKIRAALEGIRHAVLRDFSVLYKLLLSVAFLTVAAVYETLFHFLFVLAVTGLMLVAEVFNTVAEALCDYAQPRYDDRIKAIKDMAAGAAMIAILIWYTVLFVVLYELVTGTELFTAPSATG
ncbi:MAG: diacylglycerol kinase [Planctomycetes bacterium]|nr:diacylglycerol kinase [Planctomycetota bacterium]